MLAYVPTYTPTHTHTHRDKVIAISVPPYYYVVGADNKLCCLVDRLIDKLIILSVNKEKIQYQQFQRDLQVSRYGNFL